jgi:choline dehydrogenase
VESYDYIIIGAGSAGCVLANRLTASGKNTVLLLEAGGRDTNPWIHIPVGYGKTFTDPRVNWLFKSEPHPATGNRAILQPRGKVLGGSSSINGMVYIRGQREDYDLWRQLGNAGWSYDDVLPYFRKAEDQEDGADEYHGVGGHLKVSNPKDPHPLCDAFIAAAERCGYPLNDDFNGANQEGFGYYQWSLRNGRRSSAATGYLREAKRRSNLKIVTRAHATRVLFDGRRATGIEYLQGGEKRSAQVKGELILSGGSFNSPQLLQLSGVGPAELLHTHGIEVIADMKGVGANLIDHYTSRAVYRCTEPVTLNDAVGFRNLHRGVREVFRYLTRGAGMLGMGGSYAAGFFRTDPSVATPNIQCTVSLFSADKTGDWLHPFSGFTIVDRLLRPESRGTVMIGSPDPLAAPIIRPNYLSSARDCEVLLAGFKVTRKIVETEPMRRYVADEHMPGWNVQSDGDLMDYLRKFGGIAFHPVSTCRMGSDPEAVVDERLRLRGFTGLRVVDASIMPSIPSGNTNAPTIMVAEKAADMILHDAA